MSTSTNCVKKVIIIGPAYPYRGGPARFNENFCKAFIQQNIDAEIISFTLQYPSFLFPGTSQYEESTPQQFPFRINRLINTINPLSWLKTAHYINYQKPNAVIFRYWLPFFAPAFGTIAKLLSKKIKVLALTDNIIPHEKRIGDNLLNKYFLNSCDAFITMSEKVMHDLNQYTRHQHKLLLYHPLYENYPESLPQKIAREKLHLPERTKIILFFGLIRAYKGLDILLEALAQPSLKKESFQILIAGEFYEDKNKYLELIEKYQIQDKIILHDYFIPDDKVNIYFSACDAVIQPYKTATNSGVSMVSYFYNKPIISTNVGGLKEIVKDEVTGWLCEPNPHSIAVTLQKFLKIENYETFEHNIRLFKREFSWDNFVQKITHLIEQLYDKK